MIFPNLKDKNIGYVNLNSEAIEWYKKDEYSLGKNKLLIPEICQNFINDIHKKYSLDFSYGGWMEDRSFLWKDSYLDKDEIYIHLGVDINVSYGTEIATDFESEVVRIDDDNTLDGGWGPRVILKHLSEPVFLIYAHLDRNILCKVGDTLEKGKIFAKVGKPPHNGNWFEHVHVQSVDADYFEILHKNNLLDTLDGYGSIKDTEENAKKYKDPLQYISLI